MATNIKVGDQVGHSQHGNGIVVGLIHPDLADVRFGSVLKLVQRKSLRPLESSQHTNRVQPPDRGPAIEPEPLGRGIRNQVLLLIENYEFERAEKVYQEQCKNWWALKDYETIVQRYKSKQARELERVRLEQLRQTRIKELHDELRSNFLNADKFFRDCCVGIISERDFEAEKHSFVRSWLKSNAATGSEESKRIPDDEQIAAIASLHGNIQVIARAGSGKTMTLVLRALFLLRHCNVTPSEILILAFNRKAALEVRKRLLCLMQEGVDKQITLEMENRARAAGTQRGHDRHAIESASVEAVAAARNIVLPHVMTFHALAYALVHPEEGLLYDDPEGGSQGLSRAVQQIIDDHLQEANYRQQIRALMLAHFREDWDRIIAGGYDKSKDEFLQFRRSLPREALGGEFVKSYGEKVIADFLFEHEIAYRYERNWYWSGVNYRPDFTIFKTPRSGIIIEYFGLSGNADYDNLSEQKRAYWKEQPDWELIELFPSQLAIGGEEQFRASLKRSLEGYGISCERLSEDEIWHRIKDRAIDRFTNAAVGFIGRCRKQSISTSELTGKIQAHNPVSTVETMFLGLATNLYTAYLERLTAASEEDFDGLMQRASSAIDSGHTLFRSKSAIGDLVQLRYLFVDEFQDFSDLFYRLLRAVQMQNSRAELFCVGDDWQAINGFAGSDLKFFNNFEQYIGNSAQLYISENYRSLSSIVNIGNALMDGHGKRATAARKKSGTVLIADMSEFEPSILEKERHPGDIITPVVTRIIGRALADGSDVVMLGRRNALPWYISFDEKTSGKGGGLHRYLEMIRSLFPKELRDKIAISTVHKFKGLERSVVIILDAVARSYPLIHPDWAFSRVLGDSLQRIVDEERRLFYVALTRATETLIVVTEGSSKSPFVEEIERKRGLKSIDWLDFPPIRGMVTRFVVNVCNQQNRGTAPTFAIKDLLKASGFKWQSVGRVGWVKSYLAEGFELEKLKSELWSISADGLEVTILDDTDTLVARYIVDNGKWSCMVENWSLVGSSDDPKCSPLGN